MGDDDGRDKRAPRRWRYAALGLCLGAVTLGAIPLSSAAQEDPLGDVQRLLQQALKPPPAPQAPTSAPSAQEQQAEQPSEQARSESARAEAVGDPKTDPPLHGTNPHGQGTVGVVDTTPSTQRPQGGSPNGSDSGEEIVVGRARGEQRPDGTYHGHITIAALFGNEILGVDTIPGQSAAGPLDAVQTGVLTPLCNGTGNQICLTAVTADSTTTSTGSTNKYSTAHATIGGATGLDVGAAESNGNISSDGTCQTSHGDSKVADASIGGQAVADAAQSTSDSKACKNQAPTQTNSSSVLGLGGAGVPLPAPGCADGTADVVTGIPVVAPIVCGADDSNGAQADDPYGVRDALTVFALDAGGVSVLKTNTAGSESRAAAPPPQCSDGADNDGDGKVDADDPGCLSGPGGTYNPNDDNESNSGSGGGKPECSDGADNDGDGKVDADDPGCLSGPGGTYNPNDDNESNGGGSGGSGGSGSGGSGGSGGGNPECSDSRDNDGDGRIDADDPGCHSDGNVNNPASYNPTDDSEADAVTSVRRESGAGQLPMTGTDALLTMMAGLLLLGGGLELRRRVRPGHGS